MDNTTVKTFAQSIGKHPKTIIRRGATMGFSLGVNDAVPEPVQTSFQGEKASPEPPGEADGLNLAPPRLRTKQDQQKKPVDYVHGVLFGNQLIIILSATVLISVDAVSFGWIAWNTYFEFQVAASVIFALAGMAVGYSAIKNFVGYDGHDHSEWMWGFGFFQCLLHLCAMEVLGDWSFFVGKIVISVGLPLATAGLAIALKKSKV